MSISKVFTLSEEMILSLENTKPIEFRSIKTLYLNIDTSKSLFDCFRNTIEEWISRIELNRDMYSIHIIEPSDRIHGGITIKYNGTELLNLFLERSIRRKQDGKIILSATAYIKFVRTTDKVFGINQHQTFYINDQTFESTQTVNGKFTSLIEILEHVLPTRSEAIVAAISHIFRINPEEIVFDSLRKRYVIKSDYLSENWIIPSHPKRFYKYVSLEVFHNMLKAHIFRMNSIVCQSDETESLYFGNFLCNEYDDIEDRYKEILKESNILISSFTSIANDSTMWEKYGDENKGIMLGFESIKGDILTPIQYVNEAQDEFKILRDNIQSLKKNNIRIHFAEIDKMHRYIKNDRFKSENEWRLIHEFKGNIDSTLYYDKKVTQLLMRISMTSHLMAIY